MFNFKMIKFFILKIKALRVFPSGAKSELLDSFARQALWQAGLDYRHGKHDKIFYKIKNLFIFKLS